MSGWLRGRGGGRSEVEGRGWEVQGGRSEVTKK